MNSWVLRASERSRRIIHPSFTYGVVLPLENAYEVFARSGSDDAISFPKIASLRSQ